MNKSGIKKLLFSVFICLLVGFIGSFATQSSVNTWYDTLQKPFFTPPDWLFAPVWTFLYIIMGISLFFVWKEGIEKKIVRRGIVIFAIQLLLNLLWSIIFFGMRSIIGGAFEISILWILILTNIIIFFRISKIAGYLLIPYFLWISFASILNFSLYFLNF